MKTLMTSIATAIVVVAIITAIAYAIVTYTASPKEVGACTFYTSILISMLSFTLGSFVDQDSKLGIFSLSVCFFGFLGMFVGIFTLIIC